MDYLVKEKTRNKAMNMNKKEIIQIIMDLK